MNRLGIALSLLTLLLAPAARPSQQGVQATKNWKSMDQCAKEAQLAFPDYTAEASAKREIKLKECLEGKNLPPRGPLPPGR
jgi:hypothetical protein